VATIATANPVGKTTAAHVFQAAAGFDFSASEPVRNDEFQHKETYQ
jgi:hypothetical protein